MATISPNVFDAYEIHESRSAFPFTFSVVSATDVAVEIDGTPVTAGYSVSLAETGGTVTFDAPRAAGERILILLRPDYLQTSEFADQGAYNLSTINTINRRATLRALATENKARRALKVPLGEEGPEIALADVPSIVAVGNSLLEGSDIATVAGGIANIASVAGAITDVSTVAHVSAAVTTLAPISANISAVAGISSVVPSVSGIAGSIMTVAGISASVSTVAGTSVNVTAVAGHLTNIDAVAADLAVINQIPAAVAQIAATGDLTHRYATVALALTGTTDGQYSTVPLANGLAIDTYLRANGALTLQQPTLTQAGVALGQKIALLSAPGIVTPLPAGALASLDPVMAFFTDDRYVPASMGATVTHNAHPGGTEMYVSSNGAILTKNYTTDSGLGVHRIQMSAHNQLFSLSTSIAPGLIKGKFLIKSAPGAGNQNVTAGLYPSFMDAYPITESAWTTVTFSRTTAAYNQVNIWNSADTFPLDVIFREDVQISLDGENIPATEPSRIGCAVRRTSITRADTITRGSGNSIVAPFAGRILLSTRDDNGVTFSEGTFMVAFREDVANAAASGVLFTPLLGGVTGYNTNAVVIGTQGGLLDLRARGLNPGVLGSVAGKGWVIGAVRFGSNGRSLHLDGIQLAEDSTAATSFTVPYLNYGGSGYLDSQPLNGRVGVPVVYPTALSDDALALAVRNIRDRHLLMGDVFPVRNFVVPEGDSITVAGGLGGEYGYAHLVQATLSLRPWWRMMAVSGSTLATMTSRLPLVTRIGRAAGAMGYRPILTMMIGANGLPTQADLRTYWAAVRAAGYKIVVQPPTYRTAGSYTNGQADTFRAMLVGELALGNFDAYSDIYQSPVISSQTFATDAPGGIANTSDGLHWTTAIHAIVAPYMRAAIASVML